MRLLPNNSSALIYGFVNLYIYNIPNKSPKVAQTKGYNKKHIRF
jgi:hypothetical protein